MAKKNHTIKDEEEKQMLLSGLKLLDNFLRSKPIGTDENIEAFQNKINNINKKIEVIENIKFE